MRLKELILSKNDNNKKCAPNLVFFNKKNEKDSDDFRLRKLALKVKFWHFLTARHSSKTQNSIMLILIQKSMEISKFLNNPL